MSEHAPDDRLRRFTVDEYHRLIASGILTDADRVELLEGVITEKQRGNPEHAATIDVVMEALRARVPAGWRVRRPSALTTEDSEAEPDVVVVVDRSDHYVHRHPIPADVALVIEVANVSLQRDRIDKGRIYARGGVRSYWIINLIDRVVEAYALPSGPAEVPVFGTHSVHHPGERITADVGGETIEISVDDLLP